MNAELSSLRRIILLPLRGSLRWGLLLTLVLSLTQPTPAYAASLVVNTLDNELNSDGDCSLAEAIAAANSNSAVDACPAGSPMDTDTISFAVSGSIGVSQQLEVTAGGPLVMNGGGAITITLTGEGSGDPPEQPVLYIDPGADVTVKDLTITGGRKSGISNAGTLAIVHVTVSGNSALFNGGGINNSGTLTVTDSTISDNQTEHDGGGISSNGSLSITNSTVRLNDSNLDGGGIDSSGPLTLTGSTVTGNHSQRFGGGINNYGTLTMTSSTVTGNDAYRFGGGINNGGTITMSRGIVSNNLGEFGVGAILNSGTLTISASSLEGNSAYGECGGIFNTGTLTITKNSRLAGTGLCNVGTATVANSTLSGSNVYNAEVTEILGIMVEFGPGMLTFTDSTLSSSFAAQGGAIFNLGTLIVTGSTLSGNGAQQGGAIYNAQSAVGAGGAGILSITNSTLSGNGADQGGGIYNDQGRVDVQYSTLSDNGRVQFGTGGNIFNQAGTVGLYSSILADSPSGGNCAGAIIDGGYNLEDGDTCGLSPARASLSNTDPLLSPLSYNGGPTQTHALLPGSPAIDTGDPLHCPATDQRGEPRPFDGNLDGVAQCDMGAYELGVVATVDITPTILPLERKGTWMTAYIELPSGYNVGAIDLSTVRLQGTIPAANQVAKVGDHDKDGIPDIMVQFSQQALYTQLGGVRGEVLLFVTGRLRDGTLFEGWDTIFIGPKP